MRIPEVLAVLLKFRMELHMGASVHAAALAAAQGNSPFCKALRNWLARVNGGQAPAVVARHLPELTSTPARRALISALEKGLKGSPVEPVLNDLEKEFFFRIENDFERHLQLLPLKLLLPLALLILPSMMVLLLGPLLYQVKTF